jgi:hypothetical protein
MMTCFMCANSLSHGLTLVLVLLVKHVCFIDGQPLGGGPFISKGFGGFG